MKDDLVVQGSTTLQDDVQICDPTPGALDQPNLHVCGDAEVDGFVAAEGGLQVGHCEDGPPADLAVCGNAYINCVEGGDPADSGDLFVCGDIGAGGDLDVVGDGTFGLVDTASAVTVYGTLGVACVEGDMVGATGNLSVCHNATFGSGSDGGNSTVTVTGTLNVACGFMASAGNLNVCNDVTVGTSTASASEVTVHGNVNILCTTGDPSGGDLYVCGDAQVGEVTDPGSIGPFSHLVAFKGPATQAIANSAVPDNVLFGGGSFGPTSTTFMTDAFDLPTGTFTVPQTGIYAISTNLLFSGTNTSGSRGAGIRVNGGTVRISNNAPTANATTSAADSAILFLEVDDEVTIIARQNTDPNVSLNIVQSGVGPTFTSVRIALLR